MASIAQSAEFNVLLAEKKQITKTTICSYEKNDSANLGVVDISKSTTKIELFSEENESLGTFNKKAIVRVLEGETSLIIKPKIEVLFIMKKDPSTITDAYSDEKVEAGDVGYVDRSQISPLSQFGLKVTAAKDEAVQNKIFIPFANNKLTLKCDTSSSQNEFELFVETTGPNFLALNGRSNSIFEKSQLVDLKTIDLSENSVKANAESFINAKLGIKIDLPKIDDKIPAKARNDGDLLPQLQNGVDLIVCSPNTSVNVRNDKLDQVLFTAKNEEKVKIRQGFDNTVIKGTVDGTQYTFVQVEFESKEGESARIGYLAAILIKPKSACQYAAFDYNGLAEKITNFEGLTDDKCCTFPTMFKVLVPFTTGQRQFGWNRPGNRAHAANDLYRHVDEAVRSVAPGIVIRPLYKFYEGTYAIEVINGGGSVTRYGEVTGVQPTGVNYGDIVKAGQRVGYVGKVNSGCCSPMLHFELYSGKLRGPLTQNNTAINGIYYNRRQDLINPTQYLLEWQNETFRK